MKTILLIAAVAAHKNSMDQSGMTSLEAVADVASSGGGGSFGRRSRGSR